MKTILFKASYLIEVEDELLLDTDEADQFRDLVFDTLSKNRKKKIDNTHIAYWKSSSYTALYPDKRNCGKCENCGAWTTDRDLPDPIDGLSDGARINSRLLCDQCQQIW